MDAGALELGLGDEVGLLDSLRLVGLVGCCSDRLSSRWSSSSSVMIAIDESLKLS